MDSVDTTESFGNHNEQIEPIKVKPQSHHVRLELCTTRPQYRRGKKETAVKVFTIADESKFLLFHNVPCLNGLDMKHELNKLLYRFDKSVSIQSVEYENCPQFSQVFSVKFCSLVGAIRAKKQLDDREFLGSILHVNYAPEFETVDDTLEKLNARQRYVSIKVAQFKNLSTKNTSNDDEQINTITKDNTFSNHIDNRIKTKQKCLKINWKFY